MFNPRAPKLLLAALVAFVTASTFAGSAFADEAQTKALAEQNKMLTEQMQVMMQRMEELTKKVEALQKQAAAPAPMVAKAPAAGAGPAATAAPTEPKLDKFLSGFYGTIDVSLDDTTKGMDGFVAYHYNLIDPANINSGYVIGSAKSGGPVGRVGWMPALSTNKSQIGYRGEHKIGSSDTKLIYQVETALAITSAPGLKTSQYQQANVVNGAIGLGDTFIGLSGKDWGRVKFGTFYSPYKKATDRMNPFSGMLGDYSVVMGNSGGDNRVEFGTRLDHSIAYESPKWNGFSFDLMLSPGQNRTYDNTVQSSGSPDCNGGNQPGSGNLLLSCDDGGFDNAFGGAVKFETGPLYVTAAYEVHKNVNRNSDGIGANHPIYGFYFVPGVAPGDPALVCDPTILDCGTYNALAAEFPTSFGVGASPPYLFDIGDEKAFKVGAQYKFPFGLTASAVWERLTRDIPANLAFQNERQRNGFWVALSQDVTSADNVSAGWAHAGKSVGDPGGQHNYNPLAPDNSAEMFTLAWKHKLDKQLYWYLDGAVTINKANAHYDLGAGGRGLTTDCHDGTHTPVIDYTSAGNTTWGGCREEGFSTGLNFKF